MGAGLGGEGGESENPLSSWIDNRKEKLDKGGHWKTLRREGLNSLNSQIHVAYYWDSFGYRSIRETAFTDWAGFSDFELQIVEEEHGS